MTAHKDWLEHQYWSDVIKVLPTSLIEHRVEESREVRTEHSSHIDLSYGHGVRQTLDVFLPEGAGPWPVLIYIHGGYWQSNSKDDYAFLAPAWTERGVAVVTLGYRLLPSVKLTDIIADVRDGMRYLTENAEALSLDKDRILLSGLSAGAHLTAMHITSSCEWQPCAAVLLSGVYELSPVESTTPGAALADSLSADPGTISPLGRAAPTACRCLIAWGDEETDVFKSQSLMLAEHWSNWGFASERLAIHGANHFTIVDDLRGDSQSQIAQFVMNTLMPG